MDRGCGGMPDRWVGVTSDLREERGPQVQGWVPLAYLWLLARCTDRPHTARGRVNIAVG